MKVSQIILVILLTAILSIFLGMITQNYIEDQTMRVITFSFTLYIWIFIVVIVDLYTMQQNLKNDVSTYMKCN
jgi:uncharacterized membrane protein YfcA